MSALWIITVFWALHGISLMPASAGPSKCRLNLGLVVDTTKSIGKENIPYLKNSLKQLIGKVGVSQHGTHVTLETFAADSVLHNKFVDESAHNIEAIENLVDEKIDKLTMPTRLDYAIFKADEEMFIEENGDRAGVRSVMVLYTDGKSHPNTSMTELYGAIVSLKEKGVRIVVVGIGKLANHRKYRKVLKRIAGENVIDIAEYSLLESFTDDIITFICPPSPCEKSPGLDVAFVLDRTRSVGRANFKLLKGFIVQIVNALDIGPNATHTAFILFAKNAKILNTFNDSAYHSNEAVQHLIDDTSNWLGRRTFIDRALEAANRTLFTEQGGDRPTFPNVLILLTDGKTNPNSEPYGEIVGNLTEKNVRIAAVGIGRKIALDELKNITGDERNVYTANSFMELPDLFSKILNESCSADGGFSRWSPLWSKCSVTCGGPGVKMRTRTCTHPPPQGYGKDCVGNRQETKACNGGPCPLVDMNGAKNNIPVLKRYKSSFKWIRK